jgi:hypothetical protein|tara:strand:+ start:946 stop:1131 length:186 start_codon:yes stop_codon:yes gene_type:complete
MKSRTAYSSITLVIVIISFILISLGIFWLFNGIGGSNTKLVLQGSFALIFGLGIGAVANYL